MFEKLFETNVKSFWEFVKDVKPHLNPRASFLFVSSNAAYNPTAPLGLYGVSKTSLIGLTKVATHPLQRRYAQPSIIHWYAPPCTHSLALIRAAVGSRTRARGYPCQLPRPGAGPDPL